MSDALWQKNENPTLCVLTGDKERVAELSMSATDMLERNALKNMSMVLQQIVSLNLPAAREILFSFLLEWEEIETEMLFCF